MARCTSAESGGCMRVLNLSALALRRTQPDNPGAMSPPARVHCWVLGPARVTVDGVDAPPELLWRKHLALLVYLARSPRRSRMREHLVGLLWSDRDERQARHSLSEALRVFRRILGVHLDRKSTRLNSSHLVISYAVFCLKKKKNHILQ